MGLKEFDFIEDLSYQDKKIFISRQVGKINDLKEEVFYGNLIKWWVFKNK